MAISEQQDTAFAARTEGAKTPPPIPALDDMLRGLEARADLLREDARRSDSTGGIGAEAVAALDALGCHRITAPRRVGGMAAGAAAVVRASLALSRLHPAAAWNMVASSSHIATAQCLDVDPWAGLAEGEDLRMCGSYGSGDARVRRAGDEYVLTGTWTMASGSQHAQWATVDAQDDERGRVVMILPVERLEVLDTWRSLGLRGTASNTLRAEGIRVPEGAVIEFERCMARLDAETRYLRLPKVLPTSMGFAAVAIGAGTALAEEVARRGGFSPRSYPAAAAGPDPETVYAQQLGEAGTGLAAAEELLVRLAEGLDAAAETEPGIAPALQLRTRSLLGRVVRDTGEAVERLAGLAGTALTLEDTELGRLWRDCRSVLSHGALTPATGFGMAGHRALHAAAAQG